MKERKIERKLKRGGSKYNIFMKEMYSQIKENNPEMDKTQIFAEIAKLWQEQKNKGDENKEEKFNPNEDKISIIKPENTFKSKGETIKETRENKFEEIVKKYPNISFEEAILRSHWPTSVFYTDEYFIKKFKQLSNTNLTNSSPPKPQPLPSVPKRQSPKSPPKSKSPPKPPPLPSVPKRQSPKSKSKITAETLQTAKSKLKRHLDTKDPDYDLELAFKNLEKKSQSPSTPKNRSVKNEDLTNAKLEKLFRTKKS